MPSITEGLVNILPQNVWDGTSFLKVLRHLLPKGFIWGFDIDEIQETDKLNDSPLSSGNPTVGDNPTNGFDVFTDKIVKSGISLIDTTLFGKLLSCFGSELARFQERVFDMYRESIPGLSVELLEDWEKLAGLPDECSEDIQNQTIEERQCAVHTHFYSDYTLALTKQFYLDFAEGLGFTIEITEFSDVSTPFTVAPIGVDPNTGSPAESSRVGDRLNASGQLAVVEIEIIDGPSDPDQIERFKCRLLDIKPAHCVFVFI